MKTKKILTWTWMRCVRTCLLADALPANADECKQKQKKYLPDGECGCVAFVRAGVTYLRLCNISKPTLLFSQNSRISDHLAERQVWHSPAQVGTMAPNSTIIPAVSSSSPATIQDTGLSTSNDIRYCAMRTLALPSTSLLITN